MAKVEKICVLKSLNCFLPILKAFNLKNFERSDRNRIIRNVCYVIGVVMLLAIIPLLLAMLQIWHIFDNNGAIEVIVVAMPPAVTLLQSVMSYSTFTAKNRLISGTTERIQNIIDKRKCSNNDTSTNQQLIGNWLAVQFNISNL